jgi:hypothetical protein
MCACGVVPRPTCDSGATVPRLSRTRSSMLRRPCVDAHRNHARRQRCCRTRAAQRPHHKTQSGRATMTQGALRGLMFAGGVVGVASQHSTWLAPAPRRHAPAPARRASPVHDVSFDVQPGEIFGLIGPNGAATTNVNDEHLGCVAVPTGPPAETRSRAAVTGAGPRIPAAKTGTSNALKSGRGSSPPRNHGGSGIA